MKYLLVIIFLFYSLRCSSQDTIIEFDRPGAADLPYLVPLKTFQIEAGYGISIDDQASISFDNAPSFLLRFSPSKIFELRFVINYMPMSTHFSRHYQANDMFGFGVGGKVKICKQRKWWPELAVSGLVTFSNQSFNPLKQESVGAEFTVLANYFLTKSFYINYNVGYLYGGTKLGHSLSYSACFGFIMHKYVELFIEHFAFVHSQDVPDWGVDGGICIFPTPRLQIDLSYIRLFNSFLNQNTVTVGLSYNIGLHKDHYKNLFWKK